jgi:hypothetical protein
VCAQINNIVFGLCAGADNVLVDGNYVEGAATVFHTEGSFTNMIICNNRAVNCGFFFDWHLGFVNNVSIMNNNISLTNCVWGGNPAVACNFCPAESGTQTGYTNISMIGNTFRFTGNAAGASSLVFLWANNVNGFLLANNSIDAILTNSFSNCSNLNFYNNFDLAGNYRSDLNIPTVGGVPVTPVGLNLLGSSSIGSALSTLGLPNNPQAVITNGFTQPVTINTNMALVGALTITNPAGSWATLNVTPTNAAINFNGNTIAVLQTNGVLQVNGGLSSVISNTQPPSVVNLNCTYVGSPGWGLRWTNNFPENIVVYGQISNVNAVAGSQVYYNGTLICSNLLGSATMPTLLMKPQSTMAVTNLNHGFGVQLGWQPF